MVRVSATFGFRINEASLPTTPKLLPLFSNDSLLALAPPYASVVMSGSKDRGSSCNLWRRDLRKARVERTTMITRRTIPARANTEPERGLFWRKALEVAGTVVVVAEATTIDVMVDVTSPETEV
jgi:hypothetical protein